MMDDRTPEQILAEIGNQARTAINAELDSVLWAYNPIKTAEISKTR
jgi:hypothetical protein